MELMERNLRDHIALRGYDESGAVAVFGEMCKVVAYLHSNLIFHREIRIENFMVDRSGNVKLGDFKSVANFGEKDSQMTHLRQKKCLPPEAVARKHQSHKVDIWGLGAILYELLHKKMPYDTKSSYTLATDETSRRLYIKEHFSPEVKEVIKICLAQSPQDRPVIEELLESPIFSKDQKNRLSKDNINVKSFEGKKDTMVSNIFTSTLKSKTTTIPTEAIPLPEENTQIKIDSLHSVPKPPFVKSAKKQVDIFDKTTASSNGIFTKDSKTHTVRTSTSPSPVSRANDQQRQSHTPVDLIASFKQIIDIVSRGQKTTQTDVQGNTPNQRSSESPAHDSKRNSKKPAKESLKIMNVTIPIEEETEHKFDQRASKIDVKKSSTEKGVSRNQSLSRGDSPVTSRNQSKAKIESIKNESIVRPANKSLSRNASIKLKQIDQIETPKPKSNHLLTNIAISKAVPSDKLIPLANSIKQKSNAQQGNTSGQKDAKSQHKLSTMETKTPPNNSETKSKRITIPVPNSSKTSTSRPGSPEKLKKIESVNKQISAVIKSRNASPLKNSGTLSPSNNKGTKIVRLNRKADPQSRSQSPGELKPNGKKPAIKSGRN